MATTVTPTKVQLEALRNLRAGHRAVFRSVATQNALSRAGLIAYEHGAGFVITPAGEAAIANPAKAPAKTPAGQLTQTMKTYLTKLALGEIAFAQASTMQALGKRGLITQNTRPYDGSGTRPHYMPTEAGYREAERILYPDRLTVDEALDQIETPIQATEQYPGELDHLRGFLRSVGRLASLRPQNSDLIELLIDHYSDSRMVDVLLADIGTSQQAA